MSSSGLGLLSVQSDAASRFIYSGSDRGIFAFASNAIIGQLTSAMRSGTTEFAYGYGVTALTFANVIYRALALHPSGRFLFAVRETSPAGLDAYQVDGANGALTPLAGSPVAPVSTPLALALDPSGRYVYVAGSGGSLAGYAINSATGALSAISGSPVTVPSGASWGSLVEGLVARTSDTGLSRGVLRNGRRRSKRVGSACLTRGGRRSIRSSP